MISIIVDESYAYDYLSILSIKHDKKNCSETAENFEFCYDYIERQISRELHIKILESVEYRNLRDVNEETFEAVDKAKTDEVSASFVDSLNYKRYLCKKALQEKFFKSPQKENKIGYK
tara:strand:+ start:294 stop:647 length:354 start_codon:yes stop_codon:yes gene_type:complete